MSTYILPFWKKIGTSSSIIAKRVSEKLSLPTSHTGTLDPLAEGVIKIIVGEESKNKENYISEDKTYKFKFLFGISTDTHDALGLINKIELPEEIQQEKITSVLESFIGMYHQKYPNYSSKKVLGKSLWQYEREGLTVPDVFIDGELKNIKVISFGEIELKDLLKKINAQISQINGNFRQKEIKERYLENLKLIKDRNIFFCEVEVLMTRGLYVRGLARDLGEKIGIPCMILDLVRVRDGDTKKEDCLIPEEYFREEILKNQNFLFPDFKNL